MRPAASRKLYLQNLVYFVLTLSITQSSFNTLCQLLHCVLVQQTCTNEVFQVVLMGLTEVPLQFSPPRRLNLTSGVDCGFFIVTSDMGKVLWSKICCLVLANMKGC